MVFKLGELCVVHYSLEEVSCLTPLKARWGGNDKKEEIEIWIDRTKFFGDLKGFKGLN